MTWKSAAISLTPPAAVDAVPAAGTMFFLNGTDPYA
jgi:hypothetical protein